MGISNKDYTLHDMKWRNRLVGLSLVRKRDNTEVAYVGLNQTDRLNKYKLSQAQKKHIQKVRRML